MDSIDAAANRSSRWNAAILPLLVAVPIVLNAIMLQPEVTTAIPSMNDDNLHYLLLRQASAALEHGANPFDFWVPQQELGFPQFFYYQHLPHLAVLLPHRMLFESVNLFTLCGLKKILLMIGALALLTALALGGRLDRLDARLYPKLQLKGRSEWRRLRGHRR